MLNEEIKVLKTKGLQLRVEEKVIYKAEYVEEEEELELMELDEDDDVIEFDYIPTFRQAEPVSIIPRLVLLKPLLYKATRPKIELIDENYAN